MSNYKRGGALIHRGRGGRFRKATLQDMGISESQVNTGRRRCRGCGHEWWPILVTGICGECGKQESDLISDLGRELANEKPQTE